MKSLEESITDVRCFHCGSARSKFIDQCQIPVEAANKTAIFGPLVSAFSNTELWRCVDCDLYFRWPAASATQLEALYKQLAADYWRNDGSVPAAWSLIAGLLLTRFGNYRTPNVLDVGAFTGDFLESLPDSWGKFAIEPSDEAVSELRSRGIEVVARSLRDFKTSAPPRYFDAIVLVDVFEHLPDPREALKILKGLIGAGGVIILSTGNAAHWTWKLLKGKHWYLHSIQHCCFATPNFIRLAARDIGLQPTKMIRHSHRRGSMRQRFIQMCEVVLTVARSQRGPFVRRPANALTRLPFLSHLRHRVAPPFTNLLDDHLLIMLEPINTT